MGGFTNRIKQWWLTADRNQRLITLACLVGLVLLLGATASFALRPRYVTLYSNLTEQEQSQVVTDLQGMGFDVKFDRAGVVEVPIGVKDEARVRLASANKMPKAQGQWGLGELNTTPFGITPTVEQMRLKAITEGEIAKSIEAMDGVASARVHLTMPERSAFTDEQKPSTASVSLVEAADGTLTGTQGRAIALLVKNAVDGLDMKDIVVLNQHMQTLWNGEDETGDGMGTAEKKTDLDDEVSKHRQRELQALLDSALGPGVAIVTVHADVDMDSTKTTSVVRTPSGNQAVQSQDEKVDGGGASAAGGIGGVKANIPGAPSAGATGTPGSKYSGHTETKEQLVSETDTESSKALGSIRKMAVNVVVDSNKVSDPTQIEKILQGDLQNVIKVDPKTGQPFANQPFTYAVTSVPFDQTVATADKAATDAAATQQKIQQIISLLPIGALLLVAAMVIRQISKFAKLQPGVGSLASPQYALTSGGAPAIGDGELSALLAQIEGSETVSDAPPAPRPVRRAPQTEEEIEVENIKNKVHIPLEQLKKMAVERPALVGMLIKSMMLEERK